MTLTLQSFTLSVLWLEAPRSQYTCLMHEPAGLGRPRRSRAGLFLRRRSAGTARVAAAAARLDTALRAGRAGENRRETVREPPHRAPPAKWRRTPLSLQICLFAHSGTAH